MGVRHHRDLELWKLCSDIRRRVIAIVNRAVVGRDFAFGDQTIGAINSACRNTAEGFWRYGHAEFAHFVNIAKGSLGELLDSTDEALAKGYIDDREYRELNDRIEHALATATRLHRHLSGTPTPRGKRT